MIYRLCADERWSDYRLCAERQGQYIGCVLSDRDNQAGTIDGRGYDVQQEDSICDNRGL